MKISLGISLGLAAAALGLAVGLVGCASAPKNAPEVAPDVDLKRYMGTWYEQAHFEMRQQKGCVGTTATYTLREDGEVNVLNRCYQDSWDGEVKEAEAKAWVADPEESNAKLKVQFFWPFRADYWILALDEDYQWAIVGTPDRDYLWLLTREPVIEPALFEQLVGIAAERGYQTTELIRTAQRPVSERP